MAREGKVAAQGVIRRKLNAAQVVVPEGGPGADRGWRLALARAARDQLKAPLEVQALTLARAGLAEVLEAPPHRALLAVLEGPGEGLGMLAISPEVLQAMIELLTMGRVGAAVAGPRKPTRTDAAMVASLIDAALADLEISLAQEADLVWAGGWRYASFLDDPRPLGLMLEDVSYRLLTAEVDLAHGARKGGLVLALPAEGRGRMPQRASTYMLKDDAQTHHAFSEALAEEVEGAQSQLDAVLTRVSLSLSRVVGLAVGDVLPLSVATLDKVSIEGLDGRKMAEGKLGQNRGMRALRLNAEAPSGRTPVSAAAPMMPLAGQAATEPPLNFRQSA